MNTTEPKTEKRVPEEIQPLPDYDLVSISYFAQNYQYNDNRKKPGISSRRQGISMPMVHHMYQNGKIEIVSISGYLFVKVPKGSM